MMHNTLVIIGGGPRGLACAIQSIDRFKQIYIIDNEPTSSWNSLSTVSNFELRSPISFDLVTYSSNYRDYSLSNYLLEEDVIFNNQREIEEDSRRLNRKDFFDYLTFVKDKLDKNNNINFIYTKALSIYNNYVEISSGKVYFDYLILAQGVEEKQTPANLLRYRQINTIDILNKEYKSILVIGSGQGAYDTAAYLYNKGVNVGIYINKEPKIDQYPAPSYSIWKERSALGSYCSILPINSKKRYITNVKQWGPSITPNNEYLLNTIPIYISTDNNIDDVIKRYNNIFISKIGVKPLNMLNIKQEDITNNFRVLNTNIFITGPLTTLYDGPRVNSIISSSSTAIKIIEEIDASI